MNDGLQIFIVAFLPLTAFFTVVQTQPYFALLSRGIMGVVAVMMYAVMGAADVALTEALVGTLLTVILFAIAVRSALTIRVGIIEGGDRPMNHRLVRAFCNKYRLYLRWVPFSTGKELVAALKSGQIDVVHAGSESIKLLARYLPKGSERSQSITVLAEHCRWHERKMTGLREEEKIIRLQSLEKGGG